MDYIFCFGLYFVANQKRTSNTYVNLPAFSFLVWSELGIYYRKRSRTDGGLRVPPHSPKICYGVVNVHARQLSRMATGMNKRGVAVDNNVEVASAAFCPKNPRSLNCEGTCKVYSVWTVSNLILHAWHLVLTSRALPTKRESNRAQREHYEPGRGVRSVRGFQFDAETTFGEARRYGVSGRKRLRIRPNGR